MENRLEGGVCPVTGGSGGIGTATAQLFWNEVAFVAIVDLDPEALDRTARRIDPGGERVATFAADLVDERRAARVVERTAVRFGRLDVLANIAAVREDGPGTGATSESSDHIPGVNLRAVANCCKYAIPRLATDGGGAS